MDGPTVSSIADAAVTPSQHGNRQHHNESVAETAVLPPFYNDYKLFLCLDRTGAMKFNTLLFLFSFSLQALFGYTVLIITHEKRSLLL